MLIFSWISNLKTTTFLLNCTFVLSEILLYNEKIEIIAYSKNFIHLIYIQRHIFTYISGHVTDFSKFPKTQNTAWLFIFLLQYGGGHAVPVFPGSLRLNTIAVTFLDVTDCVFRNLPPCCQLLHSRPRRSTRFLRAASSPRSQTSQSAGSSLPSP